MVTSGYYDDDQPVFDPEGKYLFYRSGRISPFTATWIIRGFIPNSYRLVAVSLARRAFAALATQRRRRGQGKEKRTKRKTKKRSPKTRRRRSEDPTGTGDTKRRKRRTRRRLQRRRSQGQEGDREGRRKEGKEEKPPKPVEIDIAGFERRAVLPPKAGYFGDISAVTGKLIYRQMPRRGLDEEKSTLVFYDLGKAGREDHPGRRRRRDARRQGGETARAPETEFAIIEPKETAEV